MLTQWPIAASYSDACKPLTPEGVSTTVYWPESSYTHQETRKDIGTPGDTHPTYDTGTSRVHCSRSADHPTDSYLPNTAASRAVVPQRGPATLSACCAPATAAIHAFHLLPASVSRIVSHTTWHAAPQDLDKQQRTSRPSGCSHNPL
jgi:hypothetical protein